ncbi:MAG: SAM-dependent methyltransferase [Candidatus Loosdrechtia sp.]|uniref:SAM-dependent methyltransferase n=1 Tax=Candidatus Loosdrechtia sp. TaxID=3101272 RepID=UPI003A6E1C98|nr:MAG: methyltransferase domain-containing protein [Candidatus Jettenia sp. AMX2]
MTYSRLETTTRDYYNDPGSDHFYYLIWGGEDIHIGIYQSPTGSISAASRRTVETMCACLPQLNASARVIDIGSGYGGSARYLAGRFGCQVVCLNLSEVQNQKNRQLTNDAGLDSFIEVIDGSFENIPFPPHSFDVVWSQDAILHSGNRRKVLEEVHRVLKPGGVFIFTDPMQSDHCPKEALKPVLERIHLESLGSPGFYRRIAAQLGWVELRFEDLSSQLPVHYNRILEEITNRETEIIRHCSPEYLHRMKTGLGHWIRNGRKGYLKWGIFLFQKPFDSRNSFAGSGPVQR